MQMTPSARCPSGQPCGPQPCPAESHVLGGMRELSAFLAVHLACSGFCPFFKAIWPQGRWAGQGEGAGKHAVGVDEGCPRPGPAESWYLFRSPSKWFAARESHACSTEGQSGAFPRCRGHGAVASSGPFRLGRRTSPPRPACVSSEQFSLCPLVLRHHRCGPVSRGCVHFLVSR